MPALRIALVITELDVGGAEQSLVRLATGLDRERFLPVVYSLAPLPPAGKDRLVQALRESDVQVHSLRVRRWWQCRRAVAELTRLLRQQEPEVVQSFLFHANTVGAWAARRAHVPHWLLGVRVADPTWWRGRIERWAAGRASGVVCVSQAVADHCRDRHGFPPSKLIVIPNGIEGDLLSRTPPSDSSKPGIASGRKLLAFIGRLERQKDPRWLLEIAHCALPQLPDYELVIVGEGPLRPELERTAGSLPESDRIRFMGWREDAATILAASQVLLLTSEHEGMPNVVLEAMALAKPVVATCAEGVVELLGASSDEQTAAWRDTSAFTAKLVAIARDPARCEHLGRLNQMRAREHFSSDAMVAAYSQLYERLACS